MAFYLGIDGGGSKTACLIGDEKSVLGSGSAGGSNIVRLGQAQAAEALSTAIGLACKTAEISSSAIARTCMGAAGGGRAQVSDLLQRTLSGLVSGEVKVVGDMEIALEAAFGREPGVIVTAGTGSIVHGRNRQGETARAGGWGYAISDEGSGHWIGRRAIGAAMRALDEGRSGALLGEILKFWKLETQESLVLAANASPAPDFSSLFPVVVSAGDSGDSVARAVLTDGGVELAKLAEIVVRRLFGGETSVPLAMAGGVFANSALVRTSFYNELKARGVPAAVRLEVVEPVQGALAMARRSF